MAGTETTQHGSITIVTPADKPHLREAVEGAMSLMERAASGDPAAHKAATFVTRYSMSRPGETLDPRTYSRDPDEIRAYWADQFGPRKS